MRLLNTLKSQLLLNSKRNLTIIRFFVGEPKLRGPARLGLKLPTDFDSQSGFKSDSGKIKI